MKEWKEGRYEKRKEGRLRCIPCRITPERWGGRAGRGLVRGERGERERTKGKEVAWERPLLENVTGALIALWV